MAVQYAPLFALETQFQAKNGRNLTGGFLRVFYAATDDPADTYSDYNLTRNPDKIVLDDNGRALVICDKSKAYRLEVYDAEGMLLWTEEPVYCSGTGGGGVSITKVISTDGSISVEENVAGSTTTYDIGLAPGDSDEFLEWCKCEDTDVGDGNLYPQFVDGTMETAAGQGLHVGKDRFYHITCSFKVYPKGDGINYETLVAKLMFNDGEDHQVTVRGFDIDNSVHDPLLCEFSYDFKAPEDGYLFLDIDDASAFTMVDCELQVHRIYSGINAVPDTCATKQWVSANYQPLSGLSGYVNYSAIGGNSDNQITGINGSSIGASIDTATLTSTFVTNSIFNNYAFNTDNTLIDLGNSVSSLSSTVSGLTGTYLEQSASALFAPSGDYAYNSSISGKVDQSAFDNCCSSMSSTVSALETSVTAISSNVSGLTGVYLEQSASSLFQPSGDYAYNSALSSKLDTSAFSGVSGNFVQNSAFTSYTASALTAIDNSISSIQSSMSSMSSDVSGKVDQSAMSAWIPYSALDYSGTAISGIGGSSLAGMGGGGADYTGIYPVNVDNTAREIAVDSLPLITDSTMTSYASGDSSVIGVAPGLFFSSLPVSASAGTDSAVYDIKSAKLRSQYNGIDVMPNTVRFWENGFSAVADYSAVKRWDSAASSVSGKLDSTAQVVTATATQLYAGTAYLTSVNGAPVSASRAGNAANASLATSAYYDGTGRLISALPDSAAVSSIASGYASGKVDTSAMSSYIPYSALSGDGTSITGISGSAIGGGGATGDYVEKSATEVAIGSDNNATTYSFAQGSNNSASSYSFAQGYINEASSYSLVQGYINQASSNSFAQGSQNKASSNSFAQGYRNSAYADSFAQGERNSANAYSFAQGYRNSASYWSFAQGSGISAKNIAAVFGLNNLHGDGDTATGDSAAFAIGDGTASGSRHDLMVVTKDGEITMYSSTADTTGTGIMSAIRAISAAATGGGGIDSATCSAIASSYAESAASSKQDSSSMSAYVPFSSISADENSAITSINGSSIGGGTQVVTATGSASLKVKTTGTGRTTSTAEFITGINGTPIAVHTLSSNTTQIVENYILAFSPTNSMWTTADKASGVFAPLQYGTGAGLFIDNVAFRGYIKGNEYFVSNESYGYVRGEVHQTRGCRTIAQSTASAYASIVAKSNSAYLELSGVGAAAPVQITPSSVTSWDTVTAKMDSTAVQSAYASASATQATAQGVLYILIPDGV